MALRYGRIFRLVLHVLCFKHNNVYFKWFFKNITGHMKNQGNILRKKYLLLKHPYVGVKAASWLKKRCLIMYFLLHPNVESIHGPKWFAGVTGSSTRHQGACKESRIPVSWVTDTQTPPQQWTLPAPWIGSSRTEPYQWNSWKHCCR